MNRADAVVIISAQAEWEVVRDVYTTLEIKKTPFGEFGETTMEGLKVVLMHGGWGKIAAAASAQYALDRWRPRLLINLGTCGGIAGQVQKGEILLVEQTVVYDICERMGDPQEALDFYTTCLDLSWIGDALPVPVRRVRLLSADHDLDPGEVPTLRERFQAVAVDWESGAIAWVAARNHCPCLILRGVSDLVDETRGEAYAALSVFQHGAETVMRTLLSALPAWLSLGLKAQMSKPL
ncbi:MAG: 5'-methylthioadenosine/S-adenosylhomocysteine nucleosidase [Thermanaerothrix sp.]|uniref:5'-methylthioadenosine/S-adenosylhomocysteine nucleosidase n=1 Tax=Thermanaerothrix solaris TaxID=3058434 RepID=A0ABU3NLX2_9CHLR|nr:5'-methylthioadenosine/S-adenosylhomocysteine nucleosidase [Thermanaerothrix sp. 4228-RoL]MDT8897845.1 5'-methylthioadenosine/S-adenosylhomocysteine nucleosidase [Thermanaerothrix sp. 4228-RoL]